MSNPATDTTPIRLVMHPLVPRLLQVAGVEVLAPSMRRITFSGKDLDRDPAQPFPFTSMAVSDHVKLVFPELTSGELHLPTVADDRLVMPTGRPRPLFRDYTVRAFDGAAGRLTIDFVLHDHGVAGRWARHAAIGDALGVLGPRGSHIYPDNFGHYLIAGDETALPAMARWLEELTADASADVFVSVATMDEHLPLAAGANTAVRYLDRSVHGPTVLYDAVASFVPPPVGALFVWAAGEAGALRPLRRHVRDVLGVPAAHTDIDGYWKLGVVGLDHHEADDDD